MNVFDLNGIYISYSVYNFIRRAVFEKFNVTLVPCHQGTARRQGANEGQGLQIWRVAADILNRQSRTADKGWSSSMGVGWRANKSSP
jgi:hypothetical protein